MLQSEELRATIFNATSDAISVIEANSYTITDANLSFSDMFGLDREYVIGKNYFALMKEVGFPCLGPKECPILQATAGGKTAEHVYLDKTGQEKAVEITLIRHDDAEKDLHLIFHVARDITSRRQVELELKESLAFQEAIFQCSDDIISVIDGDTFEIVKVNQKFLDSHGLTKDQVNGKYCYAVTHHLEEPCQPPNDPCPLRATLDSGKNASEEHIHYTATGEKIYVDITTSPLKYTSRSEKRLVLHVARDITRLRLAEKALRESEKKFRMLSDAAKDAIIFLGPDGKITFWNKSAEIMFGYTADEAIGRDVHELLAPPDYLKIAHEKFLIFQNSGQGDAIGKTLELPAIRKNGEKIYFELSLAAVQLHNEWCAIGICRDISERKLAEAQLTLAKERAEEINDELTESIKESKRLALEAESANIAKSRFLASMSHELRTPLNAIIGYSEMLHEDALESGSIQLAEDLLKIKSSGQHLLALINSILDLSKIEAGKVELLVENVSMDSLLRGVVETIRPLLKQNFNNLKTEFNDVPGFLRTDAMKLRQILLNLLSNACKFTKSGEIVFRANRIRINHDERITFEVQDSGIGMTSEQLARVFTEFSQADNSISRKYGGTGLGLAIVKRLCELMGGTISAISRPGEGSTFTVSLPVVSIADTDFAKADSAPENQGKGLNDINQLVILAIDDTPESLDLISRSLTRENFRIICADSGDKGLDIARKIQPDIIFLDVIMPEKNGWEILQEIRKDEKLMHIPVILITMIDEPTKGANLGADDYLLKPVEKTKLLEVVKKLAPKIKENRATV